MNFKQLQDTIIDIRFREGQREEIKRWINLRYAHVWSQAEWPFKRTQASLTTNIGQTTPTLPADFHRPYAIYDDEGYELLWMTPIDFDTNYIGNTETGVPNTFKTEGSTVTVWPTPDQIYAFTMTYERRMTHVLNGTDTVGPMSDDVAIPIWNDEFHYVLVEGAISTGLRLENDPTYPAVEDGYMMTLQTMKEHYLPSVQEMGGLQYGADDL